MMHGIMNLKKNSGVGLNSQSEVIVLFAVMSTITLGRNWLPYEWVMVTL